MPGTDQGAVCRSWVLALIVLVIHVGKLRHRAVGDVGRGRDWLIPGSSLLGRRQRWAGGAHVRGQLPGDCVQAEGEGCLCVLRGVSSGDFFGGEESGHKQVTLLGLSGSSENPRGRWTLSPFSRQEDCLQLQGLRIFLRVAESLRDGSQAVWVF